MTPAWFGKSTMNILLVDDDVELATMLSPYLTGEGMHASLALTGKAGVEGALSGPYTAMILDIMLPDMSGINVFPSELSFTSDNADSKRRQY